jgi:hypothetical protein
MSGRDEARDVDGLAASSVGVTVPDDHVAAFVAEAFEDPERSTTWDEVIEAAIAHEARSAWNELSPEEQVRELLAMADDYDERAVEQLRAIPTDHAASSDRIDELFEEARRCRRNADRIRDAIADAYADGYVDDEALVDAVETYGFETGTIAERERLLETVTDVYDYDFRPYGGTLMTDEPGDGRDGEHERGHGQGERW